MSVRLVESRKVSYVASRGRGSVCAAYPPSAERRAAVPSSLSTQDVQPALSITISASEIVVEGKQALGLRNGQVDPGQKQGGSNGFLVTPLLNVLQQHRDRLKLIAQSRANKPFRGEVQIVADRRTPYRTLVEVLYTMGQSEFKAMRFVVLKQGAS
jgi:hypothetical protein